MSDIFVIRNYIIAYAIVLTPIILICGGLVLRKLKKKTSKWLFIAGGLWFGLLALGFVLLPFANFLMMH